MMLVVVAYDVNTEDPEGRRRIPGQGLERAQIGEDLGEGQADHVGERAAHVGDKTSGDALNRIGAGLAAPLVRGEIGRNFLRIDRTKGHEGGHQTLDHALAQPNAIRGQHLVAVTGQPPQHGFGLRLIGGLS